ncbi:MAG TPA: methyltransferase [Allosphingosinicella sp.]|nr:methyltransferase [Allosphingosinicella sp.]
MAESASPLLDLAGGYILARAIHMVEELGILDLIGTAGASSAELAVSTGMHQVPLERLLHALSGCGVLVEQDGRFACGPIGAALRRGSPDAAAVRLLGRKGMWDAFGDLRRTLETGEPALKRHRPTAMYDAGDGEAGLLADAMLAFHRGEVEGVAASCALGDKSLALDVGGGSGNLMTELLKANGGLSGIIYDRPQTEAAAQRRIAEAGLTDRCRFEGGSFFERVPAGADVYILSHVLHDWSDADALSILKNCRAAAGAGSLLLIVESVRGEADPDAASGLYDLILLGTTEGRIRSREEHRALLEQAGFRLTDVQATSRPVSIVRAVAA